MDNIMRKRYDEKFFKKVYGATTQLQSQEVQFPKDGDKGPDDYATLS